MRGRGFSCFPTTDNIELDAVLVGAGGVGAGFVATLGDLGGLVGGALVVVDGDVLTLHNLNRVLYATVVAARDGVQKVDEIDQYLRSRLPRLDVIPRAEDYGTFKRRVPRRADRRFPIVITGVDNDDVRWEVQRDLPQVLIDAATGADANCVVQRVDFLDSGCVGCARPMRTAPPTHDAECDDPPAPGAPSISFLSYFVGAAAAAEATKAATRAVPTAAYYEHVFIYGPNPDQATTLGKHPGCPVQCGDAAVAAAYEMKWHEA